MENLLNTVKDTVDDVKQVAQPVKQVIDQAQDTIQGDKDKNLEEILSKALQNAIKPVSEQIANINSNVDEKISNLTKEVDSKINTISQEVTVVTKEVKEKVRNKPPLVPHQLKNIVKSKTVAANGLGIGGLALFWPQIQEIMQSGENEIIKYTAIGFLAVMIILRYFTKNDLRTNGNGKENEGEQK